MATTAWPYVAQVDLENALGKKIVASIFDDDNDGKPEPAAVEAVCLEASVECNSFLRVFSTVTLPFSPDVPLEVKFAALQYAIAFSLRRRPDIVESMGRKAWTEEYKVAVDRMKSYVDGLQVISAAVAPEGNDGEPMVYENHRTRFGRGCSRNPFENSDD